MMLSRVTFATMDAAAIDIDRLSPFTMVLTSQARSGGQFPSTKAVAGAPLKPSTARRIASIVACRMLSVSISAAVAIPTPISATAARSA